MLCPTVQKMGDPVVDQAPPDVIRPDEFRRTSLGYQVNHLARLLEQALRREIEPYGVVPGQFAQLLALYEREPMTQRELCERVQIEQSTMAYTLQRMERDGLIRRSPDPADGRRVQISLTDRAREAREKLVDAARSVNERAASRLADNDVDEVMKVISTMIANLEREARRPA